LGSSTEYNQQTHIYYKLSNYGLFKHL
jgi:hypothetical protein